MEKYSFEKASIEAAKMTQKVESGEATSYADAATKLNSLESELPPEVVEKIMAKVQNIDEYGTAFHSLHAGAIGRKIKESDEEKLTSALQLGIVGITTSGDKRNKSEKSAKEIYLDFVRERERPNVFFSIVGRFSRDVRMAANMIMFRQNREVIAIIFDLSPFKEVVADRGKELPKLSYSNWSHSQFRTSPDNKGQINESSTEDYGFRLSSRVPPRLFKGIVVDIGVKRIGTNDELYYSKLSSKLKEITDQMLDVDKEKPEYLLPVYDIDGNLLWPKQMKHVEVRKFIAERDGQKIEKESDVI